MKTAGLRIEGDVLVGYTGIDREVVVPEGVREIRSEVFSSCVCLRRITLPESLEVIRPFAFLNCQSLERVRLPSRVTRVEEGAFQFCVALTRLELPEGLEWIASTAFARCDALRRLDVPETMRHPEILGEAWNGEVLQIPGISILRLPVELRRAALLGLAELEMEGETLPAHLEADALSWISDVWPFLLDQAADQLPLLRYLLRRNLVTAASADVLLERLAASGKVEATALLLDYRRRLPEKTDAQRIRERLRELETGFLAEDVFDASWIACLAESGGMALLEYHGADREVQLPAGRGDRPVVAVWKGLLKDRPEVTSITVPEGVRELEDGCFACLPNLRRVDLPSTLKEIPSGAFENCPVLEEVRMAPGLKVIRADAFRNSGLREAVIPEGVEILEPRAFFGCSSLTDVSLPDSLWMLGENAFGWCGKLQELRIPRQVRAMGEGIVSFCVSLASLQVDPDNEYFRMEGPFLAELSGTCLLAAVAGLAGEAVTVPEGIRHLGSWIFAGFPALKRVKLPSTLEEIPEEAFRACTALEEVSMAPGPKELGPSAFLDCGLQDLTVPEGVEIIRENCFWYCASLRRLLLPSTLKEIRDGALYHCEALPELQIPAGTKRIGEMVLGGCGKLEEITFLGIPEHIGLWNSEGLPSLRRIRMPRGFGEGKDWLRDMTDRGAVIEYG